MAAYSREGTATDRSKILGRGHHCCTSLSSLERTDSNFIAHTWGEGTDDYLYLEHKYSGVGVCGEGGGGAVGVVHIGGYLSNGLEPLINLNSISPSLLNSEWLRIRCSNFHFFLSPEF